MQSSRFTKEVQERAQYMYVDRQMYMSLPLHSTSYVLLMNLAQVVYNSIFKKVNSQNTLYNRKNIEFIS